jgi:hypothetical protein
MQYQSKINNILANVIRGKKKEEEYNISQANIDIHNVFNGEDKPDIISFENKDGEMTAIDYLINECCIEHGICTSLIKTKTRKRDVVQARQMAMFLLEKHRAGNLKEIGRLFGGRDHSTVIHSKKAIQDMIDIDDNCVYKLNKIEKKLLDYMGKTEAPLTTTNHTEPKPPFNVNKLVEEIEKMMKKSPLTVDNEILKSYKIERNTCDKILKLIEKIDSINEQ